MQPEPQATTASPSHRSPAPSPSLVPFEESGSGEPSGDDQAEEEEELEDEAGSGLPSEASGADDASGKSMLFHFISTMLGLSISKVGRDKMVF